MVTFHSDRHQTQHSPRLAEDTVYVTAALMADSNIDSVTINTVFVGNLNDGTYDVFLNPGSPGQVSNVLQFAFAIVNMGDRNYPNLIESLNNLLSADLLSVDSVSTDSYGQRLNSLFHLSGCDGALAADKYGITAEFLNNMAANSSSGSRKYDGYDSPDGCGGNSVYDVKTTIFRHVQHWLDGVKENGPTSDSIATVLGPGVDHSEIKIKNLISSRSFS